MENEGGANFPFRYIGWNACLWQWLVPLLPQPNILPCRYATACISPQGQMFTYVCIWTGERRRLICLYSAAYLIMELNILMELNIWHIILEKRHARQLLSP